MSPSALDATEVMTSKEEPPKVMNDLITSISEPSMMPSGSIGVKMPTTPPGSLFSTIERLSIRRSVGGSFASRTEIVKGTSMKAFFLSLTRTITSSSDLVSKSSVALVESWFPFILNRD